MQRRPDNIPGVQSCTKRLQLVEMLIVFVSANLALSPEGDVERIDMNGNE
jgi:hypothetical protein